jgi:hypothetical protein
MSRKALRLRLAVSFCLCLAPLLAAAAEPLPGDGAGFMAIEPVTFCFQFGGYFERLVLRSSRARIWYSFLRADSDGPGTPLLVFFNGGPGSATSCGLMSMYTGRWTLDNGAERGGDYIANPVPWTRFGHLLYIDARQTGFSYNRMERDEDETRRLQEFNAQNFNPFFDAADFVRVLLRFLAAHPGLRGRPVVLVGESYGGVRATAMLHLLLNYRRYKNGGEVYQDPALVDEIQAHYDAVFPEHAGEAVPPEVIARQFGRQVLIQPALTANYQTAVEDEMLKRPGSILYRIGEEVGIPYDPDRYPDPLAFVYEVAGRDYYIYTKPRDWLDGFFTNAGTRLRTVATLSRVTGAAARSIAELYASARADAYRVILADSPWAYAGGSASPVTRALFETPARLESAGGLEEPGDMTAVFGALQPWDRYFIGTNSNANWAFHVCNVALLRGYDIHSWDPRYGRMFLKNVAHVRTFITAAALDLVVYAAALPGALARHGDILAAARLDRSGGGARPGKIVLEYRPGAFADLPGLAARSIRFPLYDRSCHAVSLTQPLELYADVGAWLQETAACERPRGVGHE